MPRRGSHDDPVGAFISLANDPKRYGAQLDEFHKRQKSAEEAERKAAKALEKLVQREAALAELIEKVDARETAVTAREDVIVVRETSAREQTTVADALVVQVRGRETLVDGREKDLERKAAAAITAVRELVKK